MDNFRFRQSAASSSVYLDGKAYLIFEMWNNKQPIGEKRFLFTGEALIEQ